MTGIATLTQTTQQIQQLKTLQTSLADYQRQLASGKKAKVYSDLGRDVLTSQRARADGKKLDTYLYNIDIAEFRMEQMSNAITEIQTQSKLLHNGMVNQTQAGDVELDTMAPLASNIRGFMEDLLNIQEGDRYLFAGADTSNKPLDLSGGLDAFVGGQISDWIDGTIDTDTLISNYKDRDVLDDTTIGYSTTLSNGTTRNASVRVGDTAEIDYTTLANSEPMRDVLVISTMIMELDAQLDKTTLDEGDLPSDFTTAPGSTAEEQGNNFSELYIDLKNRLQNALDGMDDEIFNLTNAQLQTGERKEDLKFDRSILQEQVDNVENADMAEVALNLSLLQTQLEASYSVTASVNRISLVNFLS